MVTGVATNNSHIWSQEITSNMLLTNNRRTNTWSLGMVGHMLVTNNSYIICSSTWSQVNIWAHFVKINGYIATSGGHLGGLIGRDLLLPERVQSVVEVLLAPVLVGWHRHRRRGRGGCRAVIMSLVFALNRKQDLTRKIA